MSTAPDKISKFKKDLRLYVDEPPFAKPLKRKRTRSNGEGSIRKRPDGRFEARYTAGIQDGKLVRKSVYGKTRKECNDKLQQALSKAQPTAAAVNTKANRDAYSLSHWLYKWMDEYRSDLKPQSKARYKTFIQKIAGSAIGDKDLGAVLPIELQQIINEVESAEQSRRMICLLRDALDAAVDNRLIEINPAKNLRQPVKSAAPRFKEQNKAFTVEEENKFVAAIENHPHRIIFLLSLYAGLRRGEAVALTWDMINLDKRVLTVSQSAVRGAGKGYQLGDTKTETSMREVPISQKLCGILAELPHKSSFVLPNAKGEMLNADSVTMSFTALMRELGFEHVMHHLRHTFATRCMEKGVNIKVVQSWMGYANTDMTLNTYTHATEDLMTQETKKLD